MAGSGSAMTTTGTMWTPVSSVEITALVGTAPLACCPRPPPPEVHPPVPVAVRVRSLGLMEMRPSACALVAAQPRHSMFAAPSFVYTTRVDAPTLAQILGAGPLSTLWRPPLLLARDRLRRCWWGHGAAMVGVVVPRDLGVVPPCGYQRMGKKKSRIIYIMKAPWKSMGGP